MLKFNDHGKKEPLQLSGLNNLLWSRSKLNINKWNTILYKTNIYFCIEEIFLSVFYLIFVFELFSPGQLQWLLPAMEVVKLQHPTKIWSKCKQSGFFYARFFRVNLVVCFDSILPKYTSALLFSGINPSERHREIFVGCWSLTTSMAGRSHCNCPGLNNSNTKIK
jgi:hypothetical protein